MHRRTVTGIILASFLAFAAASVAQAQTATKPRLAVQSITATPAVMARAAGDGSGVKNVLEQILQAADSDLVDSLHKSGRFEVVAAGDIQSVLAAQDVQNSGLYDTSDPQTAHAFKLAGFKYIATVTVTSFQLIDRAAVIPDAMGNSTYTYETIQLGATLKIYDVTRGTVLDTASVTSEYQEETRKIEGSVQEGSFSNRMIGLAARDFAADATRIILDSLAPAKVIGFNNGTIFFNRGVSTGLKVGDIYEVRDPGTVMIDPETGAALGSTSDIIGWATVSSIAPKYSEAAAIELFRAPNIGHTIMRPAATLPPHLDASARAHGPFAPPARHASPSPAPPPAARSAPTPNDATASRDSVVAVFVANTAPDVPSDRVAVFDAQLRSTLSANGIRVVSRQEVLNAVSSLAADGTNAGTDDSDETRAQRMLSDQSSAVALAKQLGATAILSATINSLVVDVTTTPSLDRTVADYTLSASWTLLNGSDGISVDGGLADANERFRTSPEHKRIEINAVDRLLRNDATQIGKAVLQASASGRLTPSKSIATHREVRIETVLENMTVPEIKQVDGTWTVSANTYPLTASDAMVSVDGMLVGSTPGPIAVSEGTHRLVITHPLCVTVDRYVKVGDLMGSLRIPMTLSASGRDQWERRSQFFESLKNGAVLRATEMEKAAALAEFMKNSSITIDTSNVQNIGIGQPSLWVEAID
ncbi:MAG: hypothetical protein CMJ63_02705 [Planctomycetaceae bacterium]|nr:hypothetical protein [Planctomycetaceae bacterium]